MTQAQGTSVQASESAEQRELRELREYKAQVEASRAAERAPFVAEVTCEYVAPGTDTRGDGMFITQQPKLAVTITRKSGKPVVLRENLPIWDALMAHIADVQAALVLAHADE